MQKKNTEIFMKPNSLKLKQYKASLFYLNTYQKDALIGQLLGDANLQKIGKNFRLKFEWGDNNKEYAFKIYELFSNWILSSPKKVERINKNGNINITWRFQTFTHEVFNSLAIIFLNKDNKKFITNNLILNHLTPIGLAYWFMDDGGRLAYDEYSKGLVLNTQSFTKEEVEMLALGLKTKFNFECWVKPNKGKYIIAISGNSYDKFKDQVMPYLVPSMHYKLKF